MFDRRVFIYDDCGGGVDETGRRESCGPLEGCTGGSTIGQFWLVFGNLDVGAVVVFRVVVVLVVDVPLVVDVELVEDGLLSINIGIGFNKIKFETIESENPYLDSKRALRPKNLRHCRQWLGRQPIRSHRRRYIQQRFQR